MTEIRLSGAGDVIRLVRRGDGAELVIVAHARVGHVVAAGTLGVRLTGDELRALALAVELLAYPPTGRI